MRVEHTTSPLRPWRKKCLPPSRDWGRRRNATLAFAPARAGGGKGGERVNLQKCQCLTKSHKQLVATQAGIGQAEVAAAGGRAGMRAGRNRTEGGEKARLAKKPMFDHKLTEDGGGGFAGERRDRGRRVGGVGGDAPAARGGQGAIYSLPRGGGGEYDESV